MIALLFALACNPSEPTPLPPPAAVPVTARGRMVRSGEVQGFLARPTATSGKHAGLVLLVTQHSDATRAAAITRAQSGTIVLAITPDTAQGAAESYLQAMPDVTTVAKDCLPPRCP